MLFIIIYIISSAHGSVFYQPHLHEINVNNGRLYSYFIAFVSLSSIDDAAASKVTITWVVGTLPTAMPTPTTYLLHRARKGRGARVPTKKSEERGEQCDGAYKDNGADDKGDQDDAYNKGEDA